MALRRTLPETLEFETIYDMTRQFVCHFTTLHVERECDAHGVYLCVACSSAQRTLAKIREAIGRDEEGCSIVLKNASFMKLLVHLCNLESPDATRICTISSREMRAYYESAASCEIVGTASLLEDEPSEKLWERFFGAAASTIKKITYTVKLRRNTHRTRYDGLDAFLETVTKRGQQALDSNADPPTEAYSLIIAYCLDARHVIVYESLKAKENAAATDDSLAECNQQLPNRKRRREPPNVGDILGLVLSSECVQRVLIVKVIEDVASVWSIDHGHFHNVSWKDLINVAPSLRSVPPTVALAVLQDAEAVPYLKLLRECVKVLRVVTNHGTYEETFHAYIVKKVMEFGIADVLSNLLSFPDHVTRMTATECLIKICCRQNGREAVAKAACLLPQALLRLDDLARSHFSVGDDNSITMVMKEMRALLNLLESMFFCNKRLRLELRPADRSATVLAVVVRVYKSLPPNCAILWDVKRCLRAIWGVSPGYNSPQQQQQQQRQPEYCNSQQYRGGSRKNQGTMSGAFRPPQRRHDRETAPPAQVKLVAMTPKLLKEMAALTCYPTSEALQSVEAASRPVPTKIPKPMANCPPSSACKGGEAAPDGCFYIRRTLVPLRSDETHDPDGLVRGVVLNHKERDALRCGIDFVAGNLRPHLTPTSIGVELVPVLRDAADKPEKAHRYMVEVRVLGLHRVVYTTSEGECDLRENDKSYQARTFDVRAWIVRLEEDYLQVKNRASLKECDLPAAGDVSRC
ncbi:hypothetical protein HPB51_019986 [Rhipicephalus microplus]|uniref:Uncharacterized protein n=1 Tax=Rhipicephalus microplus TaxID=6941 RepID=A0A9J6DBT9_RHIMP|nr:hypothetical protein HPB51_019986 [Rhipicephalus microplus]